MNFLFTSWFIRMDVYHRRYHSSYKLNTKTERVVNLKTPYSCKLFTDLTVRKYHLPKTIFLSVGEGWGENVEDKSEPQLVNKVPSNEAIKSLNY